MEEQKEGLEEQVQTAAVEEPQPAPETAGPTQEQQKAAQISQLHALVASGGNWFYWIAGLSLINTIIHLFNGEMSFVLGLGATQFIDAFAQAGAEEVGPIVKIILIPISLVIAGIYGLFGYFACRRAAWAFIVGIIFFSLDTLLIIVCQDWFSALFHAWALFAISKGLSSLNQAKKLEAQQ